MDVQTAVEKFLLEFFPPETQPGDPWWNLVEDPVIAANNMAGYLDEILQMTLGVNCIDDLHNLRTVGDIRKYLIIQASCLSAPSATHV